MVLLLASAIGHAQVWQPSTPQEVLERIDANGRKFVELGAYEVSMDMSSYRSVNDAAPFDQGRSVMIKVGDRYRVDALGVTTVQDEQFTVSVDSSERMIMVGKAGPLVNEIGAAHMRTVVEKAASVSKRSTGKGVVYKIEFLRGAHYSRMDLEYDAEGWMVKMESHWGFAIQEDPDDPNSPSYTPKVVMLWGRPRKVQEAAVQGKLDISQYVIFKNNRPEAVGIWKDFELHDSRVQR